jgi:hypothetical protein
MTAVCLLCHLTMFCRNLYAIGTDTERIIWMEEVRILQESYYSIQLTKGNTWNVIEEIV